ncbi:DUF6894 family protein [Sphingomonas sp. CFBP 8760]|uniref:DUF6894 family protein n=1 Tax=Sphingomonas sp. CFBP 8760 TaxID=2775282 RepID=UPI0017863F15|nr:hypothetical protein [Sphingomonas sp. CFBP 8760]MBD8546228.1 hypothetical protein [Sphingomonas sp. CFBP 8760]
MPRFHLNIFSDIEAPDYEGIERPDLNRVIAETVTGVRDLVASGIREGRPIYRSHRIEITDGAGTLLHAVYFGDVIDLRP